MNKRIYFQLLVSFVALFFIIFPQITRADYVFQGKHFDTYIEFETYAEKYMEAWRIAYGKESVYSNTTTETNYSTQNTTTNFDIDTSIVKDISKNSARFYGKIDFKNSDRVRIWFDYDTSKTAFIKRTDTEILYDDDIVNFDRKVIELSPNTKYYYRAGGINEHGNVQYGAIRSFTTEIDDSSRTSLITMATVNATNVDENRATLRARINFKKEAFVYVWFVYGEEVDDLYMKTSKEIVYKTDGKYSSKTIKRLDPNRHYYFRAVVEDTEGEITYGKIRKFKTKKDVIDEKPKITIEKADSITLHSSILHGSVDMNDFRNGTVFFIYGEDKNEIDTVKTRYTTYNHIREKGDDRQKIFLDDNVDRYDTFSEEIFYLDSNTKYYYALGVAYENENGDDVLQMSRTKYFGTKR